MKKCTELSFKHWQRNVTISVLQSFIRACFAKNSCSKIFFCNDPTSTCLVFAPNIFKLQQRRTQVQYVLNPQWDWQFEHKYLHFLATYDPSQCWFTVSSVLLIVMYWQLCSAISLDANFLVPLIATPPQIIRSNDSELQVFILEASIGSRLVGRWLVTLVFALMKLTAPSTKGWQYSLSRFIWYTSWAFR